MSQRNRKLVGTIVLFIFLGCYALVAMALGGAVLPGAGHFAVLIYHLVAGLAWVLPAALLVRWMQRSD
ncbi:MAG: DUF2842 domain-containing protein [Hyphomicrobiaceae bacterium]|nr:DUF2842 domain-containing protein [Hyphomicrobiaceae bacterium]